MLNFYWLLNCPITNVCNRTGQIGQFGPETANLALNKGCSQPIIIENFIIDTIMMMMMMMMMMMIIIIIHDLLLRYYGVMDSHQSLICPP